MESRQVELAIKCLVRFQKLDRESVALIEEWARTIEIKGPRSILLDGNLWNDHPLMGDWHGYRSSSFSNKGRIIYRIDEENRTIWIAKITADHDYRRREE